MAGDEDQDFDDERGLGDNGGPPLEEQIGLFGEALGPWWEEHWKGMPEFHQKDLLADSQVIVNFASPGDRELFAAVVGQKMTDKTRSIWFPPAEIAEYANKRWVDPRPDDGLGWQWSEGEKAVEVRVRANEAWFAKWGHLVTSEPEAGNDD